jgi:hypothetical protein
LGKVSLTREYGTQFGQDLGSEQRRPASKERVGQFSRAAQLQSTLRVTAYTLDEKGLSIGMVNRKEVAED